jgi:hypothetical protein
MAQEQDNEKIVQEKKTKATKQRAFMDWGQMERWYLRFRRKVKDKWAKVIGADPNAIEAKKNSIVGNIYGTFMRNALILSPIYSASMEWRVKYRARNFQLL